MRRGKDVNRKKVFFCSIESVIATVCAVKFYGTTLKGVYHLLDFLLKIYIVEVYSCNECISISYAMHSLNPKMPMMAGVSKGMMVYADFSAVR